MGLEPEAQVKQLDDAHDLDARARADAAPDRAAAAPAHVPSEQRIDALAGGDVRAGMGRAFGADFSGVAIAHDGAAEAVGAQAFAQGDTVHVAAGRGDPSTREGQALLGHELAHVVQQREGRVAAPQGKGAPVVADAGLEAEADRAGQAIARGEPVPVEARATGAAAAAGAAQAKPAGAPIQMFGSNEHWSLGASAGVADYSWASTESQPRGPYGVQMPARQDGGPPFRFELTHGDLVMLSGDYFDPRDTASNDGLFQLASIPSSNLGRQPGTQDELMFAIHKHRPNDPRFQEACDPTNPISGIWRGITFSSEVEDAVENRYKRLAAGNTEHFANPTGPGSGGPRSGLGNSSGGSYRALHEDAILRAYRAKNAGGNVADAMAHEGAAQHFLTDAFAAGHLRTPRKSIRDHWDAIYPNFFQNFLNLVAHRVAVYMNENTGGAAKETSKDTSKQARPWMRDEDRVNPKDDDQIEEDNALRAFREGGITDIATVPMMQDKIWDKIKAKTAELPEITFGEIVSLISHDEDNDYGLWVTNDVGMIWQTYGDGNLDRGGTRPVAQLAVKAGCDDIQRAFDMTPNLDEGFVLSEVKATPSAPATAGDKYGAEQLMPREAPGFEAMNGKQGWEQPDLASLWRTPVRTGPVSSGETYGTKVTNSVRGGDLADELGGFAAKFPNEDHTTALGSVYPQNAYVRGFLRPFQDNPRALLGEIIDYDPSTGQAFFNTDDAVMDYLEILDDHDQADAAKAKAEHRAGPGPNHAEKGLSLAQRIIFVKQLCGGHTADDEAERIVQMFDTAPAADRRKIYAGVEGHAWGGDFESGWLSHDAIWASLSGDQLDHLRHLLNGR